MPKGRKFAPATAIDGNWYPHRGIPNAGCPQRVRDTSTGLMLTAPYSSSASEYPPSPPKHYTSKDTKNFRNSNNFSAHDNRHYFQDHGIYFGDGNIKQILNPLPPQPDTDGRYDRHLGRRLIALDKSLHHTDKHFLRHNDRKQVEFDYDTIYGSDFMGRNTSEPPTKRRFPKAHTEGNEGLAKLTTATTTWYKEPDLPHKTPTSVLAVTQEPYLPENKWKYSYHKLPNVYPRCGPKPLSQAFPDWMLNNINSTHEQLAEKEKVM